MRQFVVLLFIIWQFLLLPATVLAAASLPQPAETELLPHRSHWNPKVRGNTVQGNLLTRLHERTPGSKYNSFEDEMEPNIAALPLPERMPHTAKKLTLRDAIDLALRENPQVKIAELQRILDKFNLEVSIHNNYGVQWSNIGFTNAIQQGTYPSWGFTGGFTVPSSVGTQVAVGYTNNLLGGLGQTALTVTQPLLQNFGYEYNHIIYANALDNESIARLNFKDSVINAVVSVITAYRSLVQSYNDLDASKVSLKNQEKHTELDKLQVKVGKMAPSDLVQEQANVESTRLNVVQQQEALRTAYQSFLQALGLRANANIVIDKKIEVGHEAIPTLQQSIYLGLKHNISYQQALYNLNITKRGLIQAENSRKWTFNIVTTSTLGSERSGVGQQIYQNSPSQQLPLVAFTLSIPFDNISLKQGVVQARISIQNAEINLEQQKETLVGDIMQQWDTIRNNKQQIKIAVEALKLQIQTLKNAEIKLKYGQDSVFEVNTLETNVLTQQQSLISTKISYLNSVTTLYQTLGLTLQEWNIGLRY